MVTQLFAEIVNSKQFRCMCGTVICFVVVVKRFYDRLLSVLSKLKVYPNIVKIALGLESGSSSAIKTDPICTQLPRTVLKIIIAFRVAIIRTVSRNEM